MNEQIILPGLPVPPPAHPSSDHFHLEERRLFELYLEKENPPWADAWQMLIEAVGLRNWRKAAYIAWSCMPSNTRIPQYTKDFAPLLGLSPTTAKFREWDAHDSTAILRMRFAMRTLHQAMPDVVEQTIEEAKRAGMVGYYNRERFYKMVGLASDTIDLTLSPGEQKVDPTSLSEAELRAMIAEDDLPLLPESTGGALPESTGLARQAPNPDAPEYGLGVPSPQPDDN